MTAITERFDVGQERARLEGMRMEDLRRLARTACGYGSRTRNRHYLIHRVLWSLQAAARGWLSERPRRWRETWFKTWPTTTTSGRGRGGPEDPGSRSRRPHRRPRRPAASGSPAPGTRSCDKGC